MNALNPLLRLQRAAWLGMGLLCIGPVLAAPPLDGSTMTVPQLIARAERDNKDLQAARYAIDIGRARLQQAGLRSNPVLGVSSQSDALFSRDGEYTHTIGLSQAFPIAGRLLREKDVARVDVALAETEVAEAERQLANAVATDAYRLLVLDRQIDARAELMAAEQLLGRVTRERFKAAEVSELDVNAVQLDLQRLDQERSQLQIERDTVLAALNTRLGRKADSPLNLSGPLPTLDNLPTLTVLQAQALTLRPDLRSAQLGIDRAQAERALAKAERWEDWSVGLELSQDRLALDNLPPQRASRAIGLSLSIPLPLVNRTAGRLSEAQAAQDQAQARTEALRLTTANEVASAYEQLSRQTVSLAAYDQAARPLSERSVRLAQQGYRQGLVPLVDVVQAQRQQAEMLADHIATLDRYLQAWVHLHFAIGDLTVADQETRHD